MPSFFDLQKYAATGIASPDMTAFDKLRALAAFGGGGTVQTLTGIPPLTFKADGNPLISWSIIGDMAQTGTPTPNNPIMPQECGKLVGTDWAIPITCAGQTVTVYLGQVETTRKIKKLVLTGDENWRTHISTYYVRVINYYHMYDTGRHLTVCTHYPDEQVDILPKMHYGLGGLLDGITTTAWNGNIVFNPSPMISSLTDWKSYLADQYAAGTPVTVWYVLATPETGIINEPLRKIGDYADELHSEDAGVSIPTTKGSNTLTVDTELQPSEMTITYRG